MKKVILEGEFAEEVKKQHEQVIALRNSIENLSTSVFNVESNMWKHIKKEFPDISTNCTLRLEENKLILIDRFAD